MPLAADPSTLLDLSPMQLLGIYEELMQALYGDNGYGSDVAEIYIYRLMPNSPSTQPNRDGSMSETGLDKYRMANRRLHAICALFRDRNSAHVELLDAHSIDALLDHEPFTHRVHVRVSRRLAANPEESTQDGHSVGTTTGSGNERT